jgi:hypothetical protein
MDEMENRYKRRVEEIKREIKRNVEKKVEMKVRLNNNNCIREGGGEKR